VGVKELLAGLTADEVRAYDALGDQLEQFCTIALENAVSVPPVSQAWVDPDGNVPKAVFDGLVSKLVPLLRLDIASDDEPEWLRWSPHMPIEVTSEDTIEVPVAGGVTKYKVVSEIGSGGFGRVLEYVTSGIPSYCCLAQSEYALM
jgi:hypothetical protein